MELELLPQHGRSENLKPRGPKSPNAEDVSTRVHVLGAHMWCVDVCMCVPGELFGLPSLSAPLNPTTLFLRSSFLFFYFFSKGAHFL